MLKEWIRVRARKGSADTQVPGVSDLGVILLFFQRRVMGQAWD